MSSLTHEKLSNIVPLLYIEPTLDKSTNPIDDELTQTMRRLLFECTTVGAYNKERQTFTVGVMYKGVHYCICGDTSTCMDYLFKNNDQIKCYATNSLCIHYLQYHRNEISKDEMKKVMDVCK